MIPTKEQAWDLLCEYNEGEFHRLHARIVGDVMRYFAVQLGYADEADFWQTVGILHDLDFEQYPDQHCTKEAEILREKGVDEAVYDAGGKFVLEVENIKREAQTAGNAPGVLRVVERAAGMTLGDARVLVVIELHHAADAVVARVGQKLCRHAGIHAAGHGDEHLLSSHWQPETPAWRRSSVP